MGEPYTNSYRRSNYGSASRYDEDGYRRSDGRKKIMGYSQSQGPSRTFDGLSGYYALQDRNTRAFADPRFPGKSAGEISHNAQSMGQQINRYGQAEDAYSNRFRVNAPQRGASREENVAAAKRDGSFARLRKEYNRASTGKKMDREGNIVDRPAPVTTAAPSVAANFIDDTPEAASAAARRSGLLGKLPSNQLPAKPTGVVRPPVAKVAEENPSPSSSRAPDVVTSAQRREMLRDAAAGRSDTMTNGRITEIKSKYGTASAGVPVDDPKRVGMVKDDFGNMVPIKSGYNERRRFVESTQKGYKPSRRV